MKIKNKHRFWFGTTIIILEVFGLGTYYLSQLNWTWLSIELGKVITISLMILLINLFAFWLIKDGSEIEKIKNKK